MTYLEYKKEIEFDENDYNTINHFCKNIGIEWTASVWDVDSVRFMAKYANDIPFIKVPSACITDLELLDAINDDTSSLSPKMLKYLYAAGTVVFVSKYNASLKDIINSLTIS